MKLFQLGNTTLEAKFHLNEYQKRFANVAQGVGLYLIADKNLGWKTVPIPNILIESYTMTGSVIAYRLLIKPKMKTTGSL